MKSQDLRKFKLPDAPGVYFFKREGKILYVGKATSLRDRVLSYFSADVIETRGPRIVDMVAKADRISFQKTDSVLEALLLEAELIKKLEPPYNTEGKDDKSFNYIVITNENFPRVLVVRQKDLNSKLEARSHKLKTIFGPFPHGSLLKEALRIIRKIFPFRDNKCQPNQGKPCFNRQIGLCPGVCTGEITKEQYVKTIRRIKLFFGGKKTQILKNLELEMETVARIRNFERAGGIKKTLFALKHIQDISLIKTLNLKLTTFNYRIEAYDIAHISGKDAVGAMVVIEDGLPKKADYRKFKIRGGFGNNDSASLKELIDRRLKHDEWLMPGLFVADGGLAQKKVLEEALKTKSLSIPVVAVTKNKRHRPEAILGDQALVKRYRRAILLANAEAHRFALNFHRFRRRIPYKTN